MRQFLSSFAAILVSTGVAEAGAAKPPAQPGKVFEITKIVESKQQTDGEESGSSYDRDSLTQRVIGPQGAGLELVYDLPKSATPQDRKRDWQFPVRVLKQMQGSMQLLNAPELDARIDKWLKWGKMTRAACEHWVFTWNAFRIECDPQTVLKTIAGFDFGVDELREGVPIQFPGALESAPLHRKEPGRSIWEVALPVDPEAVKQGEARSDMVVAEIMRKPLTYDAALLARAHEQISGTISITFEGDTSGEVWRRTVVTTMDIKNARGKSETRRVTENLERHQISGIK